MGWSIPLAKTRWGSREVERISTRNTSLPRQAGRLPHNVNEAIECIAAALVVSTGGKPIP